MFLFFDTVLLDTESSDTMFVDKKVYISISSLVSPLYYHYTLPIFQNQSDPFKPLPRTSQQQNVKYVGSSTGPCIIPKASTTKARDDHVCFEQIVYARRSLQMRLR